MAEWYKFCGSGISILLNWLETARITFDCSYWLTVAWYSLKGNDNPIRFAQTASCELLLTDFGCLLYLFAGDIGQNCY